METAAGSERRSPPGPAVPPPPRGHAPMATASGPLSSPAREPPQPEEERQLRISESGQFSDGLEDRGLLESSTRLKPHEAQNYRKKALWVSWFSIIVTLALAVAAFSEIRKKLGNFGFAYYASYQASLSITNSQSLLKLMSIESVMPSSHLILLLLSDHDKSLTHCEFIFRHSIHVLWEVKIYLKHSQGKTFPKIHSSTLKKKNPNQDLLRKSSLKNFTSQLPRTGAGIFQHNSSSGGFPSAPRMILCVLRCSCLFFLIKEVRAHYESS
ncbi:hypothetical protein FD755_008979 [Muntiacus reevesi]|uniref:Transmembrane protein 163 n=1 Tax=Muntiacus reevesi TaxID=9886 RepID=A0A5J5MLE9_MUNRE|nr:hypothetical protein FD755_008979 [Muntiacus reevesi]